MTDAASFRLRLIAWTDSLAWILVSSLLRIFSADLHSTCRPCSRYFSVSINPTPHPRVTTFKGASATCHSRYACHHSVPRHHQGITQKTNPSSSSTKGVEGILVSSLAQPHAALAPDAGISKGLKNAEMGPDLDAWTNESAVLDGGL